MTCHNHPNPNDDPSTPLSPDLSNYSDQQLEAIDDVLADTQFGTIAGGVAAFVGGLILAPFTGTGSVPVGAIALGGALGVYGGTASAARNRIADELAGRDPNNPDRDKNGNPNDDNPLDPTLPRDPAGPTGPGNDLPPDNAFHCPPVSPLAIDLDGDGIELTSLEGSQTYFDLNVDGFAERTGWVQSDDGLLALDVNGNGEIDDNSELFGNATGHTDGFAHLAELDSNLDGVIDANDTQFDDLLVWRDLDGDGVSDEGELQTLSEVGITSIDLNAQEVNGTNLEHLVSHTSTVTFSDGSTGQIDDIHFQNDPSSSVALLPDDFELHTDAVIMPALWGYGQISSTWASLSIDAQLRAQAAQLLDYLSNGDIVAFEAAFEDFILDWAGVSDIDENSRGEFVNAQELAFLEKVYGTDFIDQYGGSDPRVNAGVALGELFDELVEKLAGRFIAQSATSSAVFSATTYDEIAVNVAAHPLGALTSLAENYTSSNRELNGDLADVLSGINQSIESGSITAANAAAAIFLLRHDLSDSDEEFNAMIEAAMVELDLDRESDFYIELQQEAGFESVTGAETADNLSASSSSYLVGYAGDDTISGSNSENFINGGLGDDRLNGGDAADIYFYSLGDGNDTINDHSFDDVEDRLVLADVNVDDVKFSISSGLNLIITFSNGETITVTDHFDGAQYSGDASSSTEDLELIQFADGTVLDVQAILDKMLADTAGQTSASDDVVTGTLYGDNFNGGAGNDDLRTKDGEDTLTGGLGDDTLNGGGDADTYFYSLGDGNDRINDFSYHDEEDRFVFTDVNASDVSFSQNSGKDLVITLSNGQTVTVTDHFDGDWEDMELIEFADGAVLDAQAIRDKSVADQKASGSVRGSEHAETYHHMLGDGSYVINDFSHGSVLDRLVLSDVNADDVIFSISSGLNLVITLSNGETITVTDHFDGTQYSGSASSSTEDMERIEFADGTVLNQQAILDKMLADTAAQTSAGDDVVIGTHYADNFEGRAGNDDLKTKDGDDTLTGGLGDDTLNGDEGADTYVYSLGDGNDRINDHSYANDDDRLVFTDVNVDDVTFSQNSGKDLVITLSNGETVIVTDHFDNTKEDMELIEFADGTVLGLQEIADKTELDEAQAFVADEWSNTSTTLATNIVDEFQFGNNWNGLTDADGILHVGFVSDGTSMDLSLTGYDVDYNDEIEVLINGQHHSYLNAGQNNGLSSHSVTFSPDDLLDGNNIITFVNDNPGWKWGVDDLLIA